MKFLPYKHAKQFVQELNLRNQKQWNTYCKSGNRPDNIPAFPERTYKKEWKGWGDWLGTGLIANQQRIFRSFDNSKLFVQGLKLKSQTEWREFSKSGARPMDIPANPARTYKKYWKNWSDWLGTGKTKDFRKFEDARDFVNNLQLKNREEWTEYCKSNMKPVDIPKYPEIHYKKSWKGWGDWLGTGYIAVFNRHYWPFEQATEYVHKLGIRNLKQWRKYAKSKDKPDGIPVAPNHVYKKYWKQEGKGWGYWFGTNIVATHSRKHLSFIEARKLVHKLKLKNREEWNMHCKSANKPDDIPSSPWRTYRKEWKGLGDWLGTNRIANQNKQYRKFDEAREFVRSLGFSSGEEWNGYCKSERKPLDIPKIPQHVYQDEWKGMSDWLGYENLDWSPARVKELLKGLIQSNVIYSWDEAVLYSFLLRKGLLNISGNRHEKFFKNIIQAIRTKKGRELIENYASSGTDSPPARPFNSCE